MFSTFLNLIWEPIDSFRLNALINKIDRFLVCYIGNNSALPEDEEAYSPIHLRLCANLIHLSVYEQSIRDYQTHHRRDSGEHYGQPHGVVGVLVQRALPVSISILLSLFGFTAFDRKINPCSENHRSSHFTLPVQLEIASSYAIRCYQY